jgi:hypothetical protein
MQSHSFLAVLFRIFLWFLLLNFQFLEMLASEQTKHELLGWREGGSTGLGVDWFNPVDHILLAMPNQRTASCCHYVLMPINIKPIRELDHKAIFDRRDNDRRLIALAAAPSDVPDNRERSKRGPCKPACQGIQGILENDEQAITQLLLKIHRLSPVPKVSKTAVMIKL